MTYKGNSFGHDRAAPAIGTLPEMIELNARTPSISDSAPRIRAFKKIISLR
jgi:hypothetical protein